MNVPSLIAQSAIIGGTVREEFTRGVYQLLKDIPSTLVRLEQEFGKEYLRMTLSERAKILALWLRGRAPKVSVDS
jgi:hypothetical protein